jgi:hypothetical protein
MNSQSNALSTWDDIDIQYSKLVFNYIPFINGSYQKYSGHSHKVSQFGDYKVNIDEDVSISDSPKKLFKGAMIRKVGSQYVLTERWFAGGDLSNQGLLTTPVDPQFVHPFGFLQIYAYWNQYRLRMLQLAGSVLGLRLSTTDVPDIIHNYSIDAAAIETANKNLMLTSIDYEPKSGKVVSLFGGDHRFNHSKKLFRRLRIQIRRR